MFKHILVAIDQSATSRHAFDAALDLAQALGAQLTLVHTLDRYDSDSPQQPYLAANSYSMELDELLRKDYEYKWGEFVNHYESLLKQHQEVAEAIGVRASCLQPYGRPGPAICTVARNAQADLIVVGSHGRHGLGEMFLGSVSNFVMHHAPCPVLVLHPDDQRHPTPLRERSELSKTALSAFTS
ncbi:universal stress protein [Nodosilinea sp. LEGE 07088]|uniref:universal stress protein n=1 Tax=Nodosilinea sp. LEGE 07088 TaxID=2777968 RepID=UPI00187F3394|nr:universal stress protein [Nodosilinea sp. LEGE 07088]MBE9140653.1 universal stress protein [Nodosilinea sp. LEGE 07088]